MDHGLQKIIFFIFVKRKGFFDIFPAAPPATPGKLDCVTKIDPLYASRNPLFIHCRCPLPMHTRRFLACPQQLAFRTFRAADMRTSESEAMPDSHVLANAHSVEA
jgi:hypothetical protein